MSDIDKHPCFKVRRTAHTAITSLSALTVLRCLCMEPHGGTFGPGEISIHACHPLVTGESRWSQVWLGGLVRRDRPLVPAVIKFFQETMFPRNDIDDTPGPSAVKLAKAEAQAYRSMESLHGNVVPRSYAFLQLQVDGGEIMIAHVMEYVPAITAAQLEELEDPTSSVVPIDGQLAASFISCLKQLHDHDVSHRDISPSNVLVQLPVTTPPRLLFIDFAFARKADPDSVLKDNRSLLHVLAKLGVKVFDLKNVPADHLIGMRRVPPEKRSINVAAIWETTEPRPAAYWRAQGSGTVAFR